MSDELNYLQYYEKYFDERYYIKELMGCGGMAYVFIASDTEENNQEVAVKLIRKEKVKEEEWNNFVTLFKREAKSLRRLDKLKHPNIVSFLGSSEYYGEPFIVMELLKGGSLLQRIKARKNNPYTVSEAAEILVPIADALESAHQNNIFHRDLKPANIMFRNSREPVLTDFGIARIKDGKYLTNIGDNSGTPEYMSPEQINGDREIDGRADEYSLAIIFYEMITGKKPFTGTPEQIKISQCKDPVPEPEAIPENVKRIIYKALEKDPSNRYPTIRLFGDELKKLINSNPDFFFEPEIDLDAPTEIPSAELQSKIGKYPLKTIRNKIISIMAVIVLLLLGIGIFVFLRKNQAQITFHIETATDTPLPTDTSTFTPEAKINLSPLLVNENTLSTTSSDIQLLTTTNTPIATATDTPLPTATNLPTATVTNTPLPTATNTPIATATDTPLPTATNTPTATATITPFPTTTNTARATETNTPLPTEIKTLSVNTNIVVNTENLKVGDIITFGRYEQDNDMNNGPEPIEWEILEINDDHAFVISLFGLDAQPYNEELVDVSWENSTIRAWLNNEFIEKAFDADELESILLSYVTADPNPDYKNIDPGNDTYDKIFLLSAEEAINRFSEDKNRQCKLTAFAIANDGWRYGYWDSYRPVYTDYTMWWLRTPGLYSKKASVVNYDGSLTNNGAWDSNPHFGTYGVNVSEYTMVIRPSMRIKLSDNLLSDINTPLPTATNSLLPTATNILTSSKKPEEKLSEGDQLAVSVPKLKLVPYKKQRSNYTYDELNASDKNTLYSGEQLTFIREEEYPNGSQTINVYYVDSKYGYGYVRADSVEKL